MEAAPPKARPRRRHPSRRPSLVIDTTPGKHWWRFRLRPWDGDAEQDWWFASTAIPLLAATLGPLANVFSIAALVTPWRMCRIVDIQSGMASKECLWDGTPVNLGGEIHGQSYADPHWCYALNIVSLVAGFIGNFFLLCNFTTRIRYIIALPATIIMWYIATGILIAITAAMEVYIPPTRPQQIYTQGFWYAVLAAGLYATCSMLLMINMLGYFLGHYPQTFTLTDSHRTLILQTMFFFLWMAGGAAMISALEGRYGSGGFVWGFTNALYFCDVTILTVGFGDLYPTNNVSRGLMFPYAVGGIVMLGLMVSSLTTFATELGSENVIQKHVEKTRSKTAERTVTSSKEFLERSPVLPKAKADISAPLNPIDQSVATRIDSGVGNTDQSPSKDKPVARITRVATDLLGRNRTPKLLLLREGKDRFDAMRRIQQETSDFKKWTSLAFAVIAFGILWAVGAVVFWISERHEQNMTYFQALYFCYVCLLTIGFGDQAPKSNAGRPFFVLWSLVAVPTMTILIKYFGDTAVASFKQASSVVADFTLLPKQGVYRAFLNRHPWLLDWMQSRKDRKDAKRREADGFPVGPIEAEEARSKTLEQLAAEQPSQRDLAIRLAKTIKRVARDARNEPEKQYSYEDWVGFTELIRFTAEIGEEGDCSEEEEGAIEWDWIGKDSPMMARGSEADFVFDKLCESMARYVRRVGTARHGAIETTSKADDGSSKPSSSKAVPS